MKRTRVPAAIARHFGWLQSLGYEPVDASESWGPSATYGRGEVLVHPSYEYRDEYYIERTASENPTTRAVGALKIVIASRGTKDRKALAAGHHRLHQLLDDSDPDVRRAAASALGEWRDPDALDEVLSLLEREPGDEVSPVAAAATFIALDRSKTDRQRTLDALNQFAARGSVAAEQVGELAWRLDGSRGYPKVMKLWRGPKQ